METSNNNDTAPTGTSDSSIASDYVDFAQEIEKQLAEDKQNFFNITAEALDTKTAIYRELHLQQTTSLLDKRNIKTCKHWGRIKKRTCGKLATVSLSNGDACCSTHVRQMEEKIQREQVQGKEAESRKHLVQQTVQDIVKRVKTSAPSTPVQQRHHADGTTTTIASFEKILAMLNDIRKDNQELRQRQDALQKEIDNIEFGMPDSNDGKDEKMEDDQ
jgi:hypothetical protein